MIFKKRQIVTAAMVLALGCAVLLNWHYKNPKVKSTGALLKSTTQVNLGDAQFVNGTSVTKKKNESSTQTSKDYFANARIRRKTSHDEAQEKFNKIIDDEKADEKSKQQARDNLAMLSNAIKLESDTEALIKAKTKGDCLVCINNKEAQVIVEEGKLDESRILKIQEIIISQTGFLHENITIIELNS